MARRKSSKALFSGSGKTRVVVHEDGISEFLEMNPSVKAQLMGVAEQVAAKAQSTASRAEEGAGGRITGYASAGFSVVWEARGGKRPRVNIVSNADKKTFLAAHFHSQLRDGVAHLRAALYSVAPGKHKTFSGKYKYKRGNR
jgi:hypothetical protein